jgi:hypothetical protein
MTKKGKKILVGVLVGVGSIVALVIAVGIGFGVWVTRPGELIDPGRLLSAESTGYAEWTLRLDDPGTEGFVNLLVDAVQDMPADVARSMPPFVNSWFRQAGEAKAERDLEKAFPLLAAWTQHPGSLEDEENLHLLSVSAKALGNQLVLADWIAGLVLGRSPGTTVHKYQGENIYELERGENDFEATVFARRGAVFATSNVETARRAVDLLAETSTARPAETELERLLATTEDTDPLRGAVLNSNGEIVQIWEKLSGTTIDDADAWQVIRGASLTGGLQTDGAFRAMMALVVDAPGISETYAPLIEGIFRRQFEDIPLDFEFQATAVDTGIQIEIQVPDLVEALTEWSQGRRRVRPRSIEIDIEVD